jgi:hypothetical protein
LQSLCAIVNTITLTLITEKIEPKKRKKEKKEKLIPVCRQSAAPIRAPVRPKYKPIPLGPFNLLRKCPAPTSVTKPILVCKEI